MPYGKYSKLSGGKSSFSAPVSTPLENPEPTMSVGEIHVIQPPAPVTKPLPAKKKHTDPIQRLRKIADKSKKINVLKKKPKVTESVVYQLLKNLS